MVGIDVRARQPVDTGYGLSVGSELVSTLAVKGVVVPQRIEIMAELQARLGFRRSKDAAAIDPVDLRLGVRVTPAAPLRLDLGVGMGLNHGYGSPGFRAMVGVSAVLPRHGRRDRDAIEVVTVDPDTDPVVTPTDSPPAIDLPAPRDGPPVSVADRAEAPRHAAELCRGMAEPVTFAHNSTVLTPRTASALDGVVMELHARPEIALLVLEGHASDEGGHESNWTLSTRRASAVYRYLVDAGVSPHRLSVRGWGEAQPRDGEQRAWVASDHRRVEFCVARQLDYWRDQIPDWDLLHAPVPWARGAVGRSR